MFQIASLASGYGSSEVIHDLSLSAAKNEIVAILGRNGMGKTTLFKSMMGILPVWRGKVEVDAVDVTSLETYDRVHKGLAYVPQGRMMFSMLTVEENICTALPKAAKSKVPDYVYELFPVLLEMKKRRAGNLSGGQQQQLAIARALVTEPKVLLLDEPTEGIQPSIIKDIARVLKEIRTLKGLTIVVSEQVLSFALDIADRIMVMDRGRLTLETSAKDADAAAIGRYLSV
jgi:urea transport system ATP-binding protein